MNKASAEPRHFERLLKAEQEPVNLTEEKAGPLRRFILEAMQALQIPGCAIGIVQQGKIAFLESFGVKSTASLEPVAADTRFMIGSSTKPLTTLMMARLINQGAFTWNTPVTSLLQDFALGDPEVTDRLEMRRTVGACTGMPRRDLDFIFRSKNVSAEQRLAEMKTMRPTTGFGEMFQYSNLLVATGGYAAGRCYRPTLSLAHAYEKAMQDLVFHPLGMARTCLAQAEAFEKNSAAPHAIDLSETIAPIDPTIELAVESVAPAGAVWSTAEDMAKYLLVELSGRKTLGGTSLLSEQLLRSRWRGGVKIDDQTSYGLGLIHGYKHGLENLSHPGNTLGFSLDVYFLPRHSIGVVLLTNVRRANTFLSLAQQRILELLFVTELKSLQMIAAASKFKQEAARRVRDCVKTDPASLVWLEEWTGDYRSNELGPAQIRKQGGQFSVQFESWRSTLGVEGEQSGDRLIVLTSPPWSGTFRLHCSPDGRTLLIKSSQGEYRFERK